MPALDVRSTESPGQKLVAPETVTVGASGGVKRLTVSSDEESLRQVVASVTCTENIPAVFTRMVWVVSPFVHRYVVPKLELRFTESPGQKSTTPEAVIVGGAGGVLIVTSVAEEATLQQPSGLLTCTV